MTRPNDPNAIQKLREAVASFPDRDRQILELHYADGLTPAEIGEVLGLPAAEVERALARLRRAAERAIFRTPLCPGMSR